MKNLILCFLLTIFGAKVANGQSDTNLYAEAIALYELGEYAKTVESLDKYLEDNKPSPEAYKIRGNSQLNLGNLKGAEEDYLKALELDPEYTDAIFNLGNLYQNKGSLDSSALYFKNYLNLVPDDANALMRFALISRYVLGSETPLALLERAYKLDSTSDIINYYLADEYLGIRDTLAARKMLSKAVERFPNDPNFRTLLYDLEIYEGNFEAAFNLANIAIRLDPKSFYHYQLSIRSQMLLNADPKTIMRTKQGNYKFRKYQSDETEELAKQFEDDYEDLWKRMKGGEVLGIDEYFQFYISQAGQEAYNPYGISRNTELNKLWNEEKFDELAGMAEEAFNSVPLSRGNIYKVAYANFAIGNIEEFKRLYAISFGLMEAILATGDGLDYPTAYIVVTTRDQYELMGYLGLQNYQQSLMHDGGHSYDLQKCRDLEGNEIDLFFNIDLPFSSLSNNFGKD